MCKASHTLSCSDNIALQVANHGHLSKTEPPHPPKNLQLSSCWCPQLPKYWSWCLHSPPLSKREMHLSHTGHVSAAICSSAPSIAGQHALMSKWAEHQCIIHGILCQMEPQNDDGRKLNLGKTRRGDDLYKRRALSESIDFVAPSPCGQVACITSIWQGSWWDWSSIPCRVQLSQSFPMFSQPVYGVCISNTCDTIFEAATVVKSNSVFTLGPKPWITYTSIKNTGILQGQKFKLHFVYSFYWRQTVKAGSVQPFSMLTSGCHSQHLEHRQHYYFVTLTQTTTMQHVYVFTNCYNIKSNHLHFSTQHPQTCKPSIISWITTSTNP